MFKWLRKVGGDSKASVGDRRIVTKVEREGQTAGPDPIAELVSIVGESRVDDQPSSNARSFDQSAARRARPRRRG